MSLLSQRAKERGRNAIVKRISKGVLSIEAIEELRDEYEAKKRVAMGRIRVALTARQMSVRYAIDTLSETLDIELEREFCELKSASSSAKDLVQSFPKSELDEANTAIRNLKSLLVQIDFYSSIPSRCRRLRSLLRAAPHRYLKAVYKRAMELENWHSALNREVSAAADKARQGLYKDVDLSALVSILGSHFADVSRLVAEVFEALHDTLDADISEVAKTNPERLVACAEVVEMHELLQRRLVEDARRDAARFGDGDEATAIEKLRASPGGAPSRDDALKRLYDAARRRAARMFAEHQMRLADEEYSQTSALVGAATKLVVDLDAVRKHAAPCVPEAEWQLVRVIRAAYEAHVERQLSPLWQLDERLDVGDLIQVAEWLQRYNAVISRVDPTSASASADKATGYDKSDELCTLMLCSPRRPTLLEAGVSAVFRESADRLMRLYLDRITKQVESWFASIRHREAALRRDQRGRWLTSRPEDMFQIIGTQIAVAKEHTERASKANPAHATSHFATVCLRCLEQLRADALRSTDKAQACSDAVDDYLLRGLRLARTNGSISFEAPELDGVRRVESSTAMEAANDDARDDTRQLKPEQLCAMANDALRVQDRTDALVSEEVRPILGSDNAALASVESVSSDVVADYGQVALAACSAAAAVPFVDLRDVVFVAARAPGSEQWQHWPDDEADAVDVALETLEDYLADYKTWLPEVLFPRLLRAVFDRLLKAYVDAFLRSDAPFEDSDAVAQLLLRDQNKILQYFLPKLDDDNENSPGALSATGLRDAKAVAAALAIMRDLADIVAAQPPHLPQYAVQRLIADFGTDSHAVLLSLIARHPATKAANIISTSSRRNQLLNQCKQLLQTTIATMPDGPTLATKLPGRFAPFKSDLRVNAQSDTNSGSDPGAFQSGNHAPAS